MVWFAVQSLFLLVGAFVLGLLAGWFAWGRLARSERIVVLRGDGTGPAKPERPTADHLAAPLERAHSRPDARQTPARPAHRAQPNHRASTGPPTTGPASTGLPRVSPNRRSAGTA